MKMTKRKNFKQTWKLLARSGFNVIVAGIIFALAMAFLSGLKIGGAIVAEIISLAILVFVVPQIFEMRKGSETLMTLVLGIPIGLSVVSIVSAIFPALALPTIALSGLALGSFPFVIAITSYFLADWIYLLFFK